jgi:hypothetical protein
MPFRGGLETPPGESKTQAIESTSDDVRNVTQ